MGYKLAEQVQQSWSQLDHGPYRLILGIALALPEESRRCWFGRDRYAQLLGKAPETDAEKENAYKSVQRMIKALIGAGALRLVSPAKPGRSAVYELVFPASNGGQSTSTITEMEDVQRPPSDPEWGTVNVPNGGHSTTPMEDVQRPEWGTPDVHPKKYEEEVEEEVNKPPAKAALEKHVADDFKAWYQAYPKHKGVGLARAAYKKARRNGVTADELMAGAKSYAAEQKGKDPKFTAYPASWLNQERWTDEPDHVSESASKLSPWDPAYHQAKPTVEDKMRSTIAAGQRLQAQMGAVPRQYQWCNPSREIEASEQESA